MKKSTRLGKLYLLLKFHKRLFDVPRRPAISNCEVAIEKVLEFLDHHLKPIMQQDNSYIRDSEDFLSKIGSFTSILDGSFLVTTDVVELYPSIPHLPDLNALKSALENRKEKQIPTSDLLKRLNLFCVTIILDFLTDFGNCCRY